MYVWCFSVTTWVANALLEAIYVPAIRLFQRCNTMNANTNTATNGPTMKYHCKVVLAEKKQNGTNQNKVVLC